MNILKRKLITLLCLLGITTSTTYAQDNSLLWSITGNGLTETSYIYGTIHMMCETDFTMADKITTAFNSCKQVYLELDMDNEKELKIMTSAVNGEQKLSEILTVEQQKRLDEKLQAELGLKLEILDAYSLTTISTLLTVKGMDCKVIKSYEQEFMAMAKTNGIEVLGLEKAKFQIKCLENSFDTDQAFEAIFDEDMSGIMDTLVVLYQAENLKGLDNLLSGEEYMDKNQRDWLLIKRNANWAKKMPKIMKKKATFFAVGTAHLLNDYGVIALLKAKGYTLTPVFK